MKLRLAGVDEAGRGALAGAVYAAAVILPANGNLPGLMDSKQLSPGRREQLARLIKAQAVSYHIAQASAGEVDRFNVRQASLLAMHRAVAGLNPPPDGVEVDGLDCPQWSWPSRAVVRGDALIPAISAASILAKVARDQAMVALDRRHPGYGFARHKGYPSAAHRQALRQLGACAAHRRSFAPVRSLLEESQTRRQVKG